MACVRCSSDHRKTFKAEMNIHFTGREGWVKPSLWVFPEVTVCLDCGFAEFLVPTAELGKLAEDSAA